MWPSSIFKEVRYDGRILSSERRSAENEGKVRCQVGVKLIGEEDKDETETCVNKLIFSAEHHKFFKIVACAQTASTGH